MNFPQSYRKELNRAKDLLRQYQDIPTGFFGVGIISATIKKAEEAQDSGDTVQMLKSFQELKDLE